MARKRSRVATLSSESVRDGVGEEGVELLQNWDLDDSQERTTNSCDVYKTGQVREFFGFNRAKHAVLEAAILATRVEFLAAEEILGQFEHLKVIVQKTAGVQETEAFQLLDEYVRKNCT